MIFNRTSRYICTQISTQKTSTRWILCCLNKYKAIFNIRKLLFPRRCLPNCWTDFIVNMAKNGLLLTEISNLSNTGKYVPFLLFSRNISFDSVHSLISLTSPRGRLSKQRLRRIFAMTSNRTKPSLSCRESLKFLFFFHYFSSILTIWKPGFRTRSWTEISLVSKNKMLH